MTLTTVKVPPEMEPLFAKAEETVAAYFAARKDGCSILPRGGAERLRRLLMCFQPSSDDVLYLDSLDPPSVWAAYLPSQAACDGLINPRSQSMISGGRT